MDKLIQDTHPFRLPYFLRCVRGVLCFLFLFIPESGSCGQFMIYEVLNGGTVMAGGYDLNCLP